MRQLKTVRDLATLFQKHENTIYKWILEDRLFPNAFKVKDGWYVTEADVRRLIRQVRAAAGLGTTCARPPSASRRSTPANTGPPGQATRRSPPG